MLACHLGIPFEEATLLPASPLWRAVLYSLVVYMCSDHIIRLRVRSSILIDFASGHIFYALIVCLRVRSIIIDLASRKNCGQLTE